MGRFCGVWRDKDPYNSRNERNQYNTSIDDYNCAGFALRTYSWYCPNHFPLRDMFEMLFEEGCVDFGTATDRVTDVLVNTMLKDFSGRLRVVQRVEEVRANEELIAFRVAANYDEIDYDPDYADYDFHYRVFRDQRWQEKNGDSDIHSCESPLGHEYWDAGWIIYNGPMVLLALNLEED